MRVKFRVPVLACLLMVAMLIAAQQPQPPAVRGFSSADVDRAIHSPDEFAWILFSRVNRLAPTQGTIAGNKTNNAIWETWANDPQTFPETPDPKAPPAWPPGGISVPMTTMASPEQPVAAAPKVLKPSIQQEFRRLLRSRIPSNNPMFGADLEAVPNPSPFQETRRNKETFDFIVGNNLYYRQGLASRFKSGMKIDFPLDSVEIKADWIPIQAADKAKYHWNYAADGNLYGLVAMHVISKAIPNWTWATFEWVDNPGRCDFTGCQDSFGYTPASLPPNAHLGTVYPPETITPALAALFKSAGVPAEFANYRLKGSQNDFTASDGRTTLLGNSVTENGFVQTSSCITCHSNAAFDAGGAPNPTIGFTADGQSTNGSPNPAWFYNTTTSPWTTKYMQYDFVWGLLRARSAKNP